MFLKLRLFVFGLLFLGGLELAIFQPRYIFLLAGIIVLMAFFEGKRSGGHWIFSILPSVLSIFSIAQLFLIGLVYEQQVFVLLAASMYYLALLSAYRLGEYRQDQTARGMNMASSMATIFFAYASIYGWYLNFLVPLYWLMLAYLVVTLFVSYQYFIIIKPGDKRNVWLYCFTLSLIMAEIVWTMNFWPFGYLTTGVVALILYYVLWDLIQSHFLNLLSKRRVIANMVFFSIMIIMVLITAKWIPVI
jgi:hypothetical protein